jgi:hypothetical protein
VASPLSRTGSGSTVRPILLGLLVWSAMTGPSWSEAAVPEKSKDTAPKSWGVAMGVRLATAAFKTDQDRVNDVMPLFFHEGERFRFNWPTRWRFGFAEGLSYASDIPLSIRSMTTRLRPGQGLGFSPAWENTTIKQHGANRVWPREPSASIGRTISTCSRLTSKPPISSTASSGCTAGERRI